MSVVLQFRASNRLEPRRSLSDATCQIVIFPGVRIERDDAGPNLDLGHRMQGPAGCGSLGGIDGDRPRRTS